MTEGKHVEGCHCLYCVLLRLARRSDAAKGGLYDGFCSAHAAKDHVPVP